MNLLKSSIEWKQANHLHTAQNAWGTSVIPSICYWRNWGTVRYLHLHAIRLASYRSLSGNKMPFRNQ